MSRSVPPLLGGPLILELHAGYPNKGGAVAFRFFRRIRLAPGLSLNLSKRARRCRFGTRGAKITAGTSGIRRTLSLPGIGLWYTEKVGGGSWSGRGRSRAGAGRPTADGEMPPKVRVRSQPRARSVSSTAPAPSSWVITSSADTCGGPGMPMVTNAYEVRYTQGELSPFISSPRNGVFEDTT